jgi:curved DNA-binding protein CbpA
MKAAHEVLGVPINADPATIRQAFKSKARENHPDLQGGGTQATESMKAINSAYSQLMNIQAQPVVQNTQNSTDKRNAAFEQAMQRAASKRASDLKTHTEDTSEKDWKQGETLFAEQQNRIRTDDFQQAQEKSGASIETNNAQERANFLKSLRELRSANAKSPHSQPEPIQEQATSGLKISKNFKTSVVQEWATDDKTNTALETHIEAAKTNEARMRLLSRRDKLDHTPVSAFHKAQKITFTKGKMNIYLGSRGEVGDNIIVAPDFKKEGDNYKLGKETKMFKMSLENPGQQVHTGAERILLQGQDGLKVAIHFSDQPENLRALTKTRQDHAR